MRKIYALMVAMVALCFATEAFAGTKNLYKQDFESGSDPAAMGWASLNLAAGMSIAGDEYGNYFQFSLGANNGRNCYLTWGPDIYTDQLADGKYHLEFQWVYKTVADNQFGTEISVFTGAKPAGNNAVQHAQANVLFSLTESADNHALFFVNGDTNNTMAVSEGEWMLFSLDVDVNACTVTYAISDFSGQTIYAEGIREFEAGTDMLATGLNIYAARYRSVVQMDEIKVQVITDFDIANNPTVALTGVNGSERTYSISFLDEETLHVIGTNNQETEVSYSDCDGVYTYTTTQSGTLTAWTTAGTATSEKITTEVDCSPISLPAATATISNASEGFGKEYTITVSNADVPTQPTIFINYEYKDANGNVVTYAEDKFSGEKVSVDTKGTLTITTVAPGFTSTTTTVENNMEFAVKHDIDLQHMTADELTAKGFEKMDDLDSETTSGENNWTGRKRLYYRVETGEVDDEGNPTYTNVPVYGPSTQGYEPIQRYQYLQSKLNEETAHSLFAPLYTWYGTVGVDPSNTKYYEEDGVTPKVDASGNPGGTTNVKMYLGIGLCFSGNINDAGSYNPNNISYAPILINNTTLGVDGLTDSDFIIVSKINDYGTSSVHPVFPVGTEPSTAIPEYKATNLGGLAEVYTGTQTFQLYRVDTAITRVLVLTPKDPTGINEIFNGDQVVISDHNAPVYNINGVRVNGNALQKGIYIKQGKKFVVK